MTPKTQVRPAIAEEVEQLAANMTPKARSFLLSVGIASWWRTEEGERVPQSLLRDGLIQRAKVGGIDFTQYRLAPLGHAVKAILANKSREASRG